MRSKTSYFNKTLFLKNLSRFWPLWGGASFVGALFPLALLSQLLKQDPWWGGITAPLDMTYAYYSTLQGVVPAVCLLYGLLCALAVWSYLYNARSVSLMHTLPIRREGLFVTNFLSGLAMLLLPFAVTGALCVAVTAAFGLLEPVGLLVTILGVLGESFFYFASATLAAFVTGNVFAMPAVYLVLHFLEAILDLLLSNFARGFIFGFTTDYTGVLEFLSPTVYLMRNVVTYAEHSDVAVYIEGSRRRTELILVRLENAWLIAVYALVGAVLVALAFALYRRRSSERAGDVVAVEWMRPVFRYGVAALAALLGGQLIYSMFWDDNHFKVGPLILCMLVAGVIGWYAASMLLAKTLRVFRRDNWKGLALVAAGVVAVCGCLRLDLLGAADRVPEIGQIQELYLRTGGNSYAFYPGQEDVLLEQVRALHAAIAADRDYILTLEDESPATPAASTGLNGTVADWTRASVSLTYVTTSGQQVDRYYYVPLTRDRLGRSGTYDNLLDTLVNSQEMRLKRIHASGDGYQPTGGSIYLNARSEGYDLSGREAAAILEALTRDALAGRWGQTDWFDFKEMSRGEAYAMDLSLDYTMEGAGDTRRRDWININVRPEMTATIACLLELELAKGEDLVTYAEMYPEEYGDSGDLSPEDTAVYPAAAEVVYPEPVYPETDFETVVMGNVG